MIDQSTTNFRATARALVAVGCFMVGAVRAEVSLPHVFGDNMVLQRGMEVPVWGMASPGEKVTVAIAGQSVAGVADADGAWSVRLQPLEASADPTTLTVTGTNTVTISNVVVGEVWLCSGQSNMEWPVRASLNPEQEIAAATDGLIRHLKMPHAPAGSPQYDRDTSWQICSPETVGNFTACGYFFARALREALGVPVGLLNSSWGGTRIEPWTPAAGFEGIPELAAIRERVAMADPGSDAHKLALAAHLDAVAAWLENARAANAAGQHAPPQPAFPAALNSLMKAAPERQPTTLYNGMLHPLVPFAIRGAIWYQGEANRADGMAYFHKTHALLNGWREAWQRPDLPYFFVQIAPYQYGEDDPRQLARFWEAQARILELPHTGMAVINDVGNLQNIHPANKQEVGRRLALIALAKTYGKEDVVFSGPRFKELVREGGKLRVRFENVGDGLGARGWKPLAWFEVIGANSGFEKATAVIDGPDSVLLTAPGVAEPVAMRFAWHKLAVPVLINSAGLPTGAFRAGDVPAPDALQTHVPEAADFTLVYDLDLATLDGGAIHYAVDRSGDLKGKRFDRVAYLLELRESGGAPQFAFASMDAFTDDPGLIGIPVASGNAFFQQQVANLTVHSNVAGVTNGENLAGGNIEFWPHNYSQQNAANVPGASSTDYDFGDLSAVPKNGYGYLQIHNGGAKHTVIAVNMWKGGADGADLGIGNGTPPHQDWTFARNAAKFAHKRLRVFVRLVE